MSVVRQRRLRRERTWLPNCTSRTVRSIHRETDQYSQLSIERRRIQVLDEAVKRTPHRLVIRPHKYGTKHSALRRLSTASAHPFWPRLRLTFRVTGQTARTHRRARRSRRVCRPSANQPEQSLGPSRHTGQHCLRIPHSPFHTRAGVNC
jgi:hypothetical protein